ncbi:unnamed protein product, partial [Oncorhynchus mykiss]
MISATPCYIITECTNRSGWPATGSPVYVVVISLTISFLFLYFSSPFPSHPLPSPPDSLSHTLLLQSPLSLPPPLSLSLPLPSLLSLLTPSPFWALKLEPVLNRGVQSVGEGYKAERWLLHSLQVHLLSAQLRPLLKHQEHTRKYYNEDAFLLKEPHVTAMFQYLEAVEQNNPRLLALVDTVKVGTSHTQVRAHTHTHT